MVYMMIVSDDPGRESVTFIADSPAASGRMLAAVKKKPAPSLWVRSGSPAAVKFIARACEVMERPAHALDREARHE